MASRVAMYTMAYSLPTDMGTFINITIDGSINQGPNLSQRRAA